MAKKGLCDSFCNGCVYETYATHNQKLCEYFLVTGKRRPCPAGTGCTVKEKGRRKGEWLKQKDETWARRMQEARQAKAVLLKRTCFCGVEFETYNPRQIFCSRRCANRHRQRKMQQRRREIANAQERLSGQEEGRAAILL